MLSRIANSLFWTGRYIERVEHIARFIEDQYFDSMDSPVVHKREMVLESILNVLGVHKDYYNIYPSLTDEQVLYYSILDTGNISSILSSINFARENTRTARTTVSEEFWENINRFYHSINQYHSESIQKDGVYQLTRRVTEFCSIIHGMIDKTFLKKSPMLSFIKLGIHLERSAQVCRMMMAKITDVEVVRQQRLGEAVERYQWRTLLECTSSLHISRELYPNITDVQNVVDILFLNENFPKSVIHNLVQVYNNLRNINSSSMDNRGSVVFEAGKLMSSFLYLTPKEIINQNLWDFVNQTLNSIYKIANLIENRYFKL